MLNERGLDRALAAEVDEVNLVLAATETFSRRNQGAGVPDVVAATVRMLEAARCAGVPASVTVAFSCPFEGKVGTEQVVGVVRAVLAGEPTEVALADTIGVGVPADVRRLVAAVRAETGVPLRAHFHNIRNTGYANALTAAEEGVAALDSFIGGYGGCPFAPDATGNIATDDLVYALGRSGVNVGLQVPDLTEAAAYLTAALGSAHAPALLGRAGNIWNTPEASWDGIAEVHKFWRQVPGAPIPHWHTLDGGDDGDDKGNPPA